MYARLWWKEARIFWPIWLALGGVAAGVQGLLLWARLPEARTGMLIAQGVSMSLLYAFAVGAAALAGERETQTQVFLDMLPVSRRMLWTGKVSFALATTLGLTLALAVLGALGTAERDPMRYSFATLALGYGILLLEGVAWSLLWSVVLGSALQAAALGLVTVGLLNMLVSRDVNIWDSAILAPAAALRVALAGGALLLSWVVFTRPPRPDRAVAVRQRGPGIPRRRSWLVSHRTLFGRLAWETARESRRTWLLLAGVWLGLPLLVSITINGRNLGAPWAVPAALAVLVAGVRVFGSANRTRSYRFLAHHGVSPGAVWTARVVVWGVVMSACLVATALALIAMAPPDQNAMAPPEGWFQDLPGALALAFVGFDGFVVGLFCGQIFARSITAWVITCLAFVVVVLPQFGLAAVGMIPPLSVALFPMLVLAISWAWTGDWMNDLRGPARWLRLGVLLGGTAVLLGSLYFGYRAWGVPDIGSPFAGDSAPTPNALLPLTPDQNAALDYERILNELRRLNKQSRISDDSMSVQNNCQEWDPKNEPVVEWWKARNPLIAALRDDAEKPAARFAHADLSDSAIGMRSAEWGTVGLLLGLDSSERRSRGDLAGGWDDLRTALRISAQIARSGESAELPSGMILRMTALPWALAWSADLRQTPAQLRSAGADFRSLPRFPSVVDALHMEYTQIERTLRLTDGEALRQSLNQQSVESMAPEVRALLGVVLAPSWERDRALRVVRLMYANQLQYSRLEPWERSARFPDGAADLHWTRGKTALVVPASTLRAYERSTPLTQDFQWWPGALSSGYDRIVLLSRAFEQVVALRIWQLEHDGSYPETLEALVPELLPELPRDPYSGKPFRYRRAEGQVLPLLGLSGMMAGLAFFPTESGLLRPTRPGQWLLYSVGPNEVDDGARVDCQNGSEACDLIFALPIAERNPEDPAPERKAPAAVAPP